MSKEANAAQVAHERLPLTITEGRLSGRIVDAHGFPFANALGDDAKDANRRAALIVRAVNAHDDLVASLKGMVSYAEAARTAAGMGKHQQARFDKAKALLNSLALAEPRT